MPEPVSIGVCFVAYGMLSVYSRGGSAVSSEAETLRKTTTALVESVERSQSLFGGKSAVISQLRSIANECAEADWDGHDAEPIHPFAVLLAEEFVRSLPGDIPLPEFAAEPDGAISLDWIQSRTRLFSLSIGTSQRLSYAWLDGSDKGHAVSRFDRKQIPSRILQGIRDIVDHGHTSLRSA